ncbi:ABC transporter ATP-binding protein [uncultured Cohaesibacter sp.]|uniref:ABC transporter ATP-binding protein n=1 Tax=uncultured Cohaesibacter sp. TaxID=1002546 RepID=UPI00292DB5B6|nr:ABC transporter ATP-binding protein [uncultured Cohaesibacter sp.]
MTDTTMTGASKASSDSIDHEIRSDLASLKRIWVLAGPLRGRVLASIIYRFLQSFSLGLAFGVTIMVISRLIKGEEMTFSWAWQVTGLMALSLSGQLVFGYLSSMRSWLSSYKLASHMRLGMLDHLRNLPLGFHLSRNKGDTVTVLTTDMQMLESFMSDALLRIAQAFGLPVAVLGFLFYQDWAVGLAALVSILAGIPVYLATSRWLARLGIQRQDMQAEAAARMIEYVQGISVIRAFNRIGKGQESFRAGLKAFRDISIRMVVQLSTPFVVFSAIIMLGVPLVILTSGMRYADGAIDVSIVITALVLVFSIYTPIVGLVGVMELTRMADASLTRMDRVLKACPLPRAQAPQEPDGFAIHFEDVHFGYNAEREVLKGLCFDVPENSMTAIVGLSGAGKSTILNLLPRFWDVTSGSITIGGVDVRSMDEGELSRLITVVFQDVYLFSGSIFDNIAFGRKGANLDDVVKAARAAQAHDFIMSLPDGYDTKVNEGGLSLSGGERQRISIARAILKDAPIILLDEATAALDPTNERALQTALGALVRNKTLIVVAHRLSTIKSADQILVIDDGLVCEKGHHDDLARAGGLYGKLWQHWTTAAKWRIGRNNKPTA